jgi:serine/threonine-protein kinase
VLSNDGASPGDRVPIHDLLLREAQAMAQLAHPNVVTVFDVGSVDDRVFIAMELVEGMTLAQWLVAERRERREIIATFLAAGNGLAAAHAAGLIHRDFKPDNVLIGNDGRVRVTDFGLARHAPHVSFGTTRSGATELGRGSNTTQTGLVGTLAYMAPEQFFRRNVDARADQFSFAVALYEALYGERPFAPWLSTAYQATSHHAVTVSRRSGVPIGVRQGLLRALSAEPDERYPSMDELLAALAPRSRRGRMIALGAIGAVMATVAWVAYANDLRRTADERTELVGRLRSLAPDLRAQLRSAHMLPLHDIRPARDQIRTAMRDLERQLATSAGQDARGLGDYVLGEGARALGDHDRALALLEAAWAEGERGPDIDAALGSELGASYERRFTEIESSVEETRRDAQLREIEQRYRDPAIVHLRAALAAGRASPSYLEALIAFHAHRFADAATRAHAAFVESPTFYEAGELEAQAHDAAGHALLAAGHRDASLAEFSAARQIFERVVEIARSDDAAWMLDGSMIWAQAATLGAGEDPGWLLPHALSALHNAQQINPDNWWSFLSEAEIELGHGNAETVVARDPSAYVDKAIALAEQARTHGGDADRIDLILCEAYWERGDYLARHGFDPRGDLDAAVARCTAAVSVAPNADKYGTLGVVYATRANHDGDHGTDPTPAFEHAERSYQAALALLDQPLTRYNLGLLWTHRARYLSEHGQDPESAVDAALAYYDAAVRLRVDHAAAMAGMADALVLRARDRLASHQAVAPVLDQARAAIERAFAIQRDEVRALRARLAISEIEAALLLQRDADPTPVLARVRSDLQAMGRMAAFESFARVWSCRTELLAARWSLARHGAVAPALARAAAAAARAREIDPADATAWIASAEVEQLRAQADRSARPAAIAGGLAYIERAIAIDARRTRALQVRDALIAQRRGEEPASPGARWKQQEVFQRSTK